MTAEIGASFQTHEHSDRGGHEDSGGTDRRGSRKSHFDFLLLTFDLSSEFHLTGLKLCTFSLLSIFFMKENP